MRSLLLFISVLSLSVIAKAQHFTDAGNSWILSQVNWELETAYTFQIKIDSDTLIQNQVYKTLLQADDVYHPVWHRVNYVLREDDQKIVYILDSAGQEGILYHFGLELGQQVVLWNGVSVTLKSIDSFQVANNQMQKRLKIDASDGPQSWECTSSASWIEDIGDNAGPVPFGYCLEPDISYGLGCFLQYDEVYFGDSNGWCEGFTSATIPITETGLSIFPNPVINLLTIQFSNALFKSGIFQLYNSQGQLVYHQFSDEPFQQIDMSEMASGIYILNVASGNENWICRKIVKL